MSANARGPLPDVPTALRILLGPGVTEPQEIHDFTCPVVRHGRRRGECNCPGGARGEELQAALVVLRREAGL